MYGFTDEGMRVGFIFQYPLGMMDLHVILFHARQIATFKSSAHRAWASSAQ